MSDVTGRSEKDLLSRKNDLAAQPQPRGALCVRRPRRRIADDAASTRRAISVGRYSR